MTKNTTEAVQEVLERLKVDLLHEEYCSKWDCDKCPIYLKDTDGTTWNVPYRCGWLLLLAETSRIGRR